MTTYSSFWALLLFFFMVGVFDLGQTVQVHRDKMETMRQYTLALQMRPRAEAQLQWIQNMRRDLVRLAAGDPEARRIVSTLHLQTGP